MTAFCHLRVFPILEVCAVELWLVSTSAATNCLSLKSFSILYCLFVSSILNHSANCQEAHQFEGQAVRRPYDTVAADGFGERLPVFPFAPVRCRTVSAPQTRSFLASNTNNKWASSRVWYKSACITEIG